MSQRLELFSYPLTGTQLIEASAGTGKTWTIAGLFVRLLLEGEGIPVEQLLVVTYTRAATAELKDRLRQRLADLLAAFEDGDSSDAFCRDFLAVYPLGRETAIARLQKAIAAFDEAAIFTIHGFCQRVLTEAAFEAGSDFEPELSADQDDLLLRAASDAWRREVARADTFWMGYLLEKRESPTAWVRRVKAHLGKPYQHLPVLAAQNLDQARADWRTAVQSLAAMLEKEGAAAQRLLAEHPGMNARSFNKANLPAWFAELEALAERPSPPKTAPKAFEKLAQSAMSGLTKKGFEVPANPLFDVVDGLVGVYGQILQALEAHWIALCHRLVPEIEAALTAEKAAAGITGFDDLLTRLASALTGEGSAALQQRVCERYRVALIDEFQDTDPIQWQIFAALFADGGLPLTLVGDPKQAIYRFRGADLHTYLAAGRSAAQSWRLDTNWRSVPALMAGINTLFDPLRRPQPFIEDIAYEAVGARGRLQLRVAGEASAAPFQFRLLAQQHNSKGEPCAWKKGEASTAAIAATAAEIVALLSGGAVLEDGENSRPLAPGDIAVLATSHAEAAAMENALAASAVPAVRQTRESVLASTEALELYCVLLAVAAPRDARRVKAALVSAAMGLGALELDALRQDEAAWVRTQQHFLHWHERWHKVGFIAFFRDWLESGVAARLRGLPGGERRLTNMLHLGELLQAESHVEPGMERLVQWLARRIADPQELGDAALLRLPSDAERVRIVTIHASKGLEYPVVFCPWLWNGKLLHDQEIAVRSHDAAGEVWLDFGSPDYAARRAAYQEETLAEKLRLLYVALTRAKSRLVICWGQIDCAKGEKDDWRDEEGLHTSALAWLLHGGETLQALYGRLAGMGQAGIAADLAKLIERCPEAFAVTPAPDDPGVLHCAASAPGELAVASWSRQLAPSWQVASFTRLSSGATVERPDHDAGAAMPQFTTEKNGFTFPGGEVPANVAGTCLHAMFEDWAAGADDLTALAARHLERDGIGADWQPVVTQMLITTLAAPLDGQILRLQNLGRTERRAEIEFTFPLTRIDLQQLPAILAHHKQPAAFIDAAYTLNTTQAAGFMKGFIDLVFRHDGRYYLLDWKSNWLGHRVEDYAAPQLQAAMASHHYYLQALIYAVALDRYLALRVAGYDFERHFGGAYYLFLRGLQMDSAATGIWHARPGRALLDELGEWLSGAAA